MMRVYFEWAIILGIKGHVQYTHTHCFGPSEGSRNQHLVWKNWFKYDTCTLNVIIATEDVALGFLRTFFEMFLKELRTHVKS